MRPLDGSAEEDPKGYSSPAVFFVLRIKKRKRKTKYWGRKKASRKTTGFEKTMVFDDFVFAKGINSMHKYPRIFFRARAPTSTFDFKQISNFKNRTWKTK